MAGTKNTSTQYYDKKFDEVALAAGYIEKGRLYSTETGTFQGNIISPTLLTVTLSGLESAVKKAAPKEQDKINICIYADDFIITGATREVLEKKVKPALEAFLQDRGLTLSQEKTKITHIDEGFDFLGVNIRKYNGKCIIKPAKSSVKRFLTEIRESIKANATVKTEYLIYLLNPKIRGWGNYYRHICAKETFAYVGHNIFLRLWRWVKRRHPNKNMGWIKSKYFRNDKLRNWIFSTKVKDKEGNVSYLDLVDIAKISIKRHVKLKAASTPYDPQYHEYLDKRLKERSGKRKLPSWWSSLWNF